VIFIICVFIIILYGYFLRKTKTQDFLAKRIFHHPICQDIDGWSVSHLLFFGLLGFLYPGRHLQFLTMGVLWEIIETGLGQNKLEVSGKRLQLLGEQDEDGNMTGEEDAFWYGKESDIIVDIAGYCVGSALAERYWPDEGKKPKLPVRRVPLRASPPVRVPPTAAGHFYVPPPSWL
jgi:hypothetical protein